MELDGSGLNKRVNGNLRGFSPSLIMDIQRIVLDKASERLNSIVNCYCVLYSN